MSEEQEQAAILLERCRDKLSGHEIEALERISSADNDGFSIEDYRQLQSDVEEAEDALAAAQEALEEAKSEYGDPVTMAIDEDILTRLCTEFADQLA